ncbi:lipid phosphate phosphatase epsilon 2, chloroplastic-like isoform X2 [Silene latifolia]|uniref:lipid phosphate phosphatase epsilon 2, chloroplastic-like isoform X2 n=1 Tax=Silene latifolia TaxID=37657 RepID=UPI003D773DB2
MEERVFKIQALETGDSKENISVLEQENLVDGSSSVQSYNLFYDFESTLNRLSKWLVAAIFGAVILWRHDPEAVWAVMGSVLNSVLSVVLKRMLNQERPVSNRRSDPGMPSSHAQSIFFAAVFVIISMVEWLGVNEFTLIFAAVSLALGSYFSWLRVAQRFHTVSQVAVGAILGACFSLLWAWSWDVFVSDAFTSLLWVRIAIFLGSAICCLGFLVYVVLNWFTEER